MDLQSYFYCTLHTCTYRQLVNRSLSKLALVMPAHDLLEPIKSKLLSATHAPAKQRPILPGS